MSKTEGFAIPNGTVDVLYEGQPVARGANLRVEDAGAFIELDAPLPVGTRLTVRAPEGDRPARVERVQESAGPGMLVRYLDAPPVAAKAPEPALAAGAAPVAAGAAPVLLEPTESEPIALDGSEANGEASPDKKPPRKRKKTRI